MEPPIYTLVFSYKDVDDLRIDVSKDGSTSDVINSLANIFDVNNEDIQLFHESKNVTKQSLNQLNSNL